MSRRRVAEAADVVKGRKAPVDEDPTTSRIRQALAQAKEADESVDSLTQKSRAGIRAAEDLLSARKQEAQSKVSEASRSIQALVERTESRVRDADGAVRASELQAQSTTEAADEMLAEAERIQNLLQKRLRILKVVEIPRVKEPVPSQLGLDTDPSSILKRELTKAQRLWDRVEELTREQSKEFALLESEDEIRRLSDRVWSAVVAARCLDEGTMANLFLNLDSMNRTVPDDEAARLRRLVRILLFTGNQVLLPAMDATRATYYDEAKHARSWLVFFSRKTRLAECDRLKEDYDSFRGLGSEVSGAWSALVSRWTSLTQLITARETQAVGRLIQTHPNLLPWNDKGRPPQKAPAAPAPAVRKTKYCTACGAALTGTKFCTKCGRPTA